VSQLTTTDYRMIIVIIIAIILFFVMRKWFNSVAPKTPDSTILPGTGIFTDWTGSLNHAAQLSAMKSFCNMKGYDYSPPGVTATGEYGSCLYNEQTCNADSNPHWVMCSQDANGNYVDSGGKPCDPNQMPYLEWHVTAGEGRCLVSNFAPGFITNVCESQGLGGWYKGTPVCDASGYCSIDPSDIPTCILKSDYCDKMGLDYQRDIVGKGIGLGGTGSRGIDIGNCDLSDWQNITEGIFGKTITRTVKRNAEAMIRECHDNPVSANCALGIGQFALSGGEIVVATVDKEFQGYMDDLKTACSGNIYQSFDSFEKCGASLFPGFYLSKQLVSFTDGILDGMIGWIPGIPKGLIGKGIGYVGKYGEIAVKAIFHAGEQAIHAFDIAGDYCKSALENIGLGAEGKFFIGAISNIVKFGVGMAKVIAGVAKEAINIFVQDIVPVAYHVFHAVTDAVLHPKEFFSHIAKDLANFFTNPQAVIKNAFTAIVGISNKIFHAVKMVVNYLRKVAGQILGEVGDALIDIAKHLESFFKDLGNDIKDIAEQAWDGFKSIF